MKKILLFTAMVAFAGFTNAQVKVADSNTVQTQKLDGNHKNFEKWSLDLKLDEAQKAKIMDINKKYIEEKRKLRESGDREAFKALDEKQNAEIEAVLTPEQVNRNRAFIEKRGGENAVRMRENAPQAKKNQKAERAAKAKELHKGN